jgi:hypothetical protein
LRKYLYCIHNNPEFEQIDFEEYSHTMRLRDFWTNLISENPELLHLKYGSGDRNSVSIGHAAFCSACCGYYFYFNVP